MLKTHAVGIDLGTTYSCIAYLNEHGQPVTLPNQEGELSTPSVVLFDESGEVVVGTEALRNTVVKPHRVIQNAKRYLGDPKHQWQVDGRVYTPLDISCLVLKKLLAAAAEQIGKIEQAVITVPAQFSEIQRQLTVEAGLRAGLKRVDIINEPVAAALCYVLGTEGLWFTELADEQRILVYDLGGGTFDLSLVRYHSNEVKVIASSGDLNLGGIDWNSTLLEAIAGQFAKEFGVDPRQDPHSLQFLALEVENTKRSLTVRPRAALTCQHGGHRKSYQVEQPQFEKLTKKLVDRTCGITQQMLKDNRMGWAHVDVILTVGGSSRMPMIRNALKVLGGRTLNTSLSPDQSIAHGATYYAGMLLTNNDFAKSILSEEVSQRLASIRQQSVSARGLGILVRDEQDNRVPHYLIPANSPLPVSASQSFGTVIPNQKRVHLRIVESGTAADQKWVELGTCVIESLPEKLPENSQIEVTIHYDEQARVHVSAKDVTSGQQATTEIVRAENLVRREAEAGSARSAGSGREVTDWQSSALAPSTPSLPVRPAESLRPAARPRSDSASAAAIPAAPESVDHSRSAEIVLSSEFGDLPDSEGLEGAGMPVPLCNECGEPLDHRGQCAECGPTRTKARASQKPAPSRPSQPEVGGTQRRAGAQQPLPRKPAAGSAAPARKPGAAPSGGKPGATPPGKPGTTPSGKPSPALPTDDQEILELEFPGGARRKAPRPASQSQPQIQTPPQPQAQPQRVIRPKKAAPSSPSVKSPPLPPALNQARGPRPAGSSSAEIRTGELGKDGEDEFWSLEE